MRPLSRDFWVIADGLPYTLAVRLDAGMSESIPGQTPFSTRFVLFSNFGLNGRIIILCSGDERRPQDP